MLNKLTPIKNYYHYCQRNSYCTYQLLCTTFTLNKIKKSKHSTNTYKTIYSCPGIRQQHCNKTDTAKHNVYTSTFSLIIKKQDPTQTKPNKRYHSLNSRIPPYTTQPVFMYIHSNKRSCWRIIDKKLCKKHPDAHKIQQR